MKASRAFTLIELAVVLAVTAVLAALLTPFVAGYMDQARTTRSAGDLKAIAEAYQLHKRDTSQFPIYDSNSDADSNTYSTGTVGGAGNPPAADSGGTDWIDLETSSGTMESLLNTNRLALPTNNPGRGLVAYRGPYIETIGADPWGNAYVVNAAQLTRSSTNIGFALSAGPDGNIDTDATQPTNGTLIVGEDDIVVRIK